MPGEHDQADKVETTAGRQVICANAVLLSREHRTAVAHTTTHFSALGVALAAWRNGRLRSAIFVVKEDLLI
jgi:hypothetical protein